MHSALQRITIGRLGEDYRAWLEKLGAAKAESREIGSSMFLELHIAEGMPGCDTLSYLASRGAFITWHGVDEGYVERLMEKLSYYGRTVAGAPMSDDASWGVRALRAAATAVDLKTVALSGSKASILAAAQGLGIDIVYPSTGELEQLLREGVEYAPLYIDTYLSQYYSLENMDERNASKLLGLYLAARSLLEYTGSNSLLLDCEGLSSYHPLTVLALMLDEGVPAACIEDYHGLTVQAVSLALTGKPAILESGRARVTPTLVSTGARLQPTSLGLAPIGEPRGVTTWITVKNRIAYLSSAGGSYGIPAGMLWPVALAYLYLGYETPGIGMPARVIIYRDGERLSRIL